MGSLSGMLGTAGGMNGTGIQAPTNPVSAKQLEDAYGAAQSGLTQQQAFTNAVNPGGTQALQSQQQLLSQLQQGAQGQGPNPALAQLAQTTGANAANQAALMAGQRGSSANPALMARQAAMQGAGMQQQATGQAATLAAQQQLAQQQALAAQQAQMVGQQSNATNAYTNATQNEQSNLLGGTAAANQNRTQLAGQVMGQQGNMIGNIMGGIGSGLMMKAEGGEIQRYAEGAAPVQATDSIQSAVSGPKSSIGKAMQEVSTSQDPLGAGANKLGQGIGTGIKSLMTSAPPQGTVSGTAIGAGGGLKSNYGTDKYAHGGKVPALVSPGERYLSPDKVAKVAQGASPMAEGKKVPGKPKVTGAKDSYANDTVKADLDEGGIVIPRSVTQAKDAEKKAIAFVRAVLAKKGGHMPKKS